MEHLNNFLLYCRIELSLSQNTISSYKSDLEDLFVFLQTKDIKAVSKRKIEQYCMDLSRRGYKTSSINRKLSSILHFTKYLFESGVIDSNFSINISKIKDSRKIPDFLTKEQVDKLIKTATESEVNGLQNGTIVSLLYASGGRISEIVNLKLSSLEFDGKNKIKPYIRLHGKGDKDRVVPIDNKTKDILEKYLSTVDRSNGFLFPSRKKSSKTGKIIPISRVYVGLTLKNIATSAGIDLKLVHPHTFRHSIAVHLLNNGMDIRVIQEFLGHKDISTTAIYTHIKTKEMESLIENHHRLCLDDN